MTLSNTFPGPNAAVDGPSAAATGTGTAEPVDWNLRPFTDEDLPAVVALMNFVDDSYKLQQGTSELDLRERLGSPRSDPARQIVLADGPTLPGVSEGELLGYGRLTYENDETQNERMYYLDVVVHRAAEGTGLDRVLVGKLMEILRGYEQDPGMQQMGHVTVKAWALEPLVHIRDLWDGIGLREVRQFWTMARDLDKPIDEPQPIDGVNIRAYRGTEDNVGAAAAFNNSFADHWDHHPVSQEEWDYWMDTANFRPELSLLAEIDGAPGTFAGFCINSISEGDNKRRNVCEGWIDVLGTIREWRRKGLGRALLLHGLHALRSGGMDTALLGVDSTSLTGANRLYESVGFRIRNREFGYAAPLDEVKA
jgi:mycothiol synthase